MVSASGGDSDRALAGEPIAEPHFDGGGERAATSPARRGDVSFSGGDPAFSGGDPDFSGGDPAFSGGDPAFSSGGPAFSGGDDALRVGGDRKRGEPMLPSLGGLDDFDNGVFRRDGSDGGRPLGSLPGVRFGGGVGCWVLNGSGGSKKRTESLEIGFNSKKSSRYLFLRRSHRW